MIYSHSVPRTFPSPSYQRTNLWAVLFSFLPNSLPYTSTVSSSVVDGVSVVVVVELSSSVVVVVVVVVAVVVVVVVVVVGGRVVSSTGSTTMA